jgi:hypothetical protein
MKKSNEARANYPGFPFNQPKILDLMQEIEITDKDLEAAKIFAAEITKEGPAILQVLPDGEIRVNVPQKSYLGSVLFVTLHTWDPSKQSEQDRIDEIALQFEEERLQAEQLVEIV